MDSGAVAPHRGDPQSAASTETKGAVRDFLNVASASEGEVAASHEYLKCRGTQ